MKLDLRRFGEAKDQRAEFLETTAEVVRDLEVLRNRVLVGTYVQAARSKGGILMPDRTLDESRFQGKCGVVLKLGPMAFEFGDAFEGRRPVVGDWVFYRTADTWECGIAGAPCRFVYDDNIVGIISDPSQIW